MPLPNLMSTDAASRRTFLRSAGVLTAGAAIGGRPAAGGAFPAPGVLRGTYRASGKPRPDLLDSRSPAGLEVIQLTSSPAHQRAGRAELSPVHNSATKPGCSLPWQSR